MSWVEGVRECSELGGGRERGSVMSWVDGGV